MGPFLLVGGGVPLMAPNGIKVNMTPSHPGDFIRTEVIIVVGPERDKGGPDSRGPSGNAFGPAERQCGVVGGDGAVHREGLRRQHGHAPAEAGLV